MDINAAMNRQDVINAALNPAQPDKTTEKTKEIANPAASQAVDQLAGSGVVYEKSDVTVSRFSAADPERVKSLLAESQRQTEAFRKMIEKLLQKQGETAVQAQSAEGMYDILRPEAFGEKMVEIDEATRKAAQESISEDGYYGVAKTSGRILDFASAVAGNDPKKLEEMKSAFLAGFKQAAQLWGDELPEISHQTYEAVLQGFADMETKLKGGEPKAAL